MPVNPKSLENLQPAKPGEVRNPDGRGKGTLNFKTRARWLLDATEEITHPVTGEKITISVTDQIDVQLIRAARKGEPWAIKEVFDRLEGKASPIVEGGININFNSYAKEQREKYDLS